MCRSALYHVAIPTDVSLLSLSGGKAARRVCTYDKFSSKAQLTGTTGPIGEKGFGKAIIVTRVLDLADSTIGLWPFKLPSFDFCKLKLLLIQVKAISRRAAFYGYL